MFWLVYRAIFRLVFRVVCMYNCWWFESYKISINPHKNCQDTVYKIKPYMLNVMRNCVPGCSFTLFANQLVWLSPYSWWKWLTFVRLCRNINLSVI